MQTRTKETTEHDKGGTPDYCEQMMKENPASEEQQECPGWFQFVYEAVAR